MKKLLFSFLLGLCFFFFNLDSSFAADTVEENSITISESTYSELSINEKINSIKEVKRVADTIVIIVFDDGTVVIVVIRN